MATSTERDLMRVPIFDGTAKSWHYWSNTFTAVLEQKELGVIVDHLKDDKTTPTDDDDCLRSVDDGTGTGSMMMQEDALLVKIKKQNTRAFAIMLSSMNIKVETGTVAWNLIMLQKDESQGYKGGNFKAAFLALEDLYRPKNQNTLGELKNEYNKKTMAFQDHPATFIAALDELRHRMKELGKLIDDSEFILDILLKLPSSKNKRGDGVYHGTRKAIESRMEDDVDFNTTKVTLLYVQRKLVERYTELHQANDDVASKELALNASQVKVKCYKCGEWGHKSNQCSKQKQWQPNQRAYQSNPRGGGFQGRGRGGRGFGGRGFGRGRGRGSNNLFCTHCHRTNHTEDRCWDKMQGKPASSDNASSATSYSVVLCALEQPEMEPKDSVPSSFFDN